MMPQTLINIASSPDTMDIWSLGQYSTYEKNKAGTGYQLLLSVGPFIQLLCHNVLIAFMSIYERSYFYNSDCFISKYDHNFEYKIVKNIFLHFQSIHQKFMKPPTMLNLGETLHDLHQK